MKPCLAAIAVALVAGWFWVSWYVKLVDYKDDVLTIKSTLIEQGHDNVKVFPLSRGCYTYNSYEGSAPRTGTICLGDKP